MTTRRGAVLFEILVSIAIFVGVGAFTLSAMRSSISALERAQERQTAIDLARSKLAELEAGLVSITQLQGDVIDGVGSFETFDDASSGPGIGDDPRWRLEVNTSRSGFIGLTLVEMTVYPADALEGEGGVTLRQLVRLGGQDAEAYEEDELLEGLPGDGS